MVTVRLLDPRDLDLLLSAGTDVFDNPIAPDLAEAYLSHPDYRIALAVAGDKVVGMATGLFYFHPDKPLEFFINEVGVAETHHRQGIAKRLLTVLLEAARERGVRYCWVGTESDNVAAQALYRSTGGMGQEMAYFEYDLTIIPEKSKA